MPQFCAGDTIGGFLELPEGVGVKVEQNVVGYYQRMISILEQVSAYLRSRGEVPNLEMAEDMCQLDMVACASPGWGSRYEIDKREVVAKCVNENAWVIEQLIQTKPGVIVFSGRSAFNMFNQIFQPFITPALPDEMDVYGLMKLTASKPHYLDIQSSAAGSQYHLRARVLISPHFSYDDNFLPQARFGQEDWAAFGEQFPAATAVLLGDKDRVSEPNRDGYRGIRLDGLGSFKTDHPEALVRLIQKLFDASALIGDGIAQEVLLDNVGFAGDHLVRSAGPCRFCDNDHWRFPGGCPYGQPAESEPPVEGGLHDAVVDFVERTALDAAEEED